MCGRGLGGGALPIGNIVQRIQYLHKWEIGLQHPISHSSHFENGMFVRWDVSHLMFKELGSGLYNPSVVSESLGNGTGIKSGTVTRYVTRYVKIPVEGIFAM